MTTKDVLQYQTKPKRLIKKSYLKCIRNIHGTVEGTIKDLEESGWIKTDQPTPGSVLIWEAIQNGEDCNEHIGFYIGREKAVSNSSTKKKIIIHNWTYNNTRKIKAIYSNLIKIN